MDGKGIIEFNAQGMLNPAEAQQKIDGVWWQLFDVVGAVEQLSLHIADLGSDMNPEQHTRDAYERDLRYFLNWAGPKLPRKDMNKLDLYTFARNHPTPRFPGPGLLVEYIAHLKKERGLARATVDRYMAPVRFWIRALRKQYIPAKGDARDFVSDCKDFMLLALEEKAIGSEKILTQGALYEYGTRLKVNQVDAIFATLAEEVADDGNLLAYRDLALLYVGFNTGLRNAEIRRLCLSNISEGEHTWEIKVRRKRNKYGSVALDDIGRRLIDEWVEAYNGGLPEGDPRRIGHQRTRIDAHGKVTTEEVPIFQPLHKGGWHRELNKNGFDPMRGLAKSSLAYITKKRTKTILGVEITPHDMRRTLAATAWTAGMGKDVIKIILGHSRSDTTDRYVGEPTDLRRTLLSERVNWSIAV